MARVWDWRAERQVSTGWDRMLRAWEWRTGKPLAPPVPFSGPGYQVQVTPDDRFAIVAGQSRWLHAVDLGDLNDLPPRLIGRDDLRTLAELFAGQVVHPGGGLVNLTTTEWVERWSAFRSSSPQSRRRRVFDEPPVDLLLSNTSAPG